MAELNAPPDDDGIIVTLHHEDTATVVHVTGDIDLDTAPALRAAVAPTLGLPTAHTVIFDLSAVSFIDSAGLAVLISVARDGRPVLLRHPSDVLVRVIAATGLTETLPVER
jgi:anti-anti-sigma factor